jgi:DNA-binding phage protein
MTIQGRLMDLVRKRGLRRVAQELGIDHGQLYRSIHSDLRLSTLQSILNLFGYELKIVKRMETKDKGGDRPGQDGETTS